MNDIVDAGMETAVVTAPTLMQEIVGTVLDTFRQLPQPFQMIFLGAGLLSAVGLTAYGINQGYGVKKTEDGLHITNQTPVIQ